MHTHTGNPLHCLVIGGGVVGASAARALAGAGCLVTILDHGAPGAASPAAGGMLAPQIEAASGDPILPLALAARDRYAALLHDLEQRGAGPVARPDGGITLVGFDDARAAALQSLAAAQRALGLDAVWLDRPALRTRHPGIGPDATGGLLAPRDGAVDNVALVHALLTDARRLGATLRTDTARALISDGGRVSGVRTDAGLLPAEWVVLAAGAWAGQVHGLPRTLPIEPVRGQMAAVPWPAGEPAAVLFGRGAYVVPRAGEAILGSTMEHAGFVPGTTAEGLDHIRRETAALLPSLANTPTRVWSGLRPMTPDHRPIIGVDPDLDGLVYATGHGRNGILLGPITGEVVADLITTGATSWDLAPYAATRFPVS